MEVYVTIQDGRSQDKLVLLRIRSRTSLRQGDLGLRCVGSRVAERIGNLRLRLTATTGRVRGIWVVLLYTCVQNMGHRSANRRVLLRYVLTAFLVVVKNLKRVTSKVRISYVFQRNNATLIYPK